MTRSAANPATGPGGSDGATRSARTIGVEMFLALEDLTGAGTAPALDPVQGAVLARLEEETMQRRQPDAGKIAKDDVRAVLEEIATAHFGLGEQM